MTWGINNAGPVGVQPFAPGVVGQPPGQAGANLPPFFNGSFESVMAAVSRGELPLNVQVPAGNQFGGVGNANGNPTLLQAISQGLGQNGTNGLNGKPGSGGTVNSGFDSLNTAPGTFDNGTSMGGTMTVDAKQMVANTGNAGGVAATSAVNPAPVQGNMSTAASGGTVSNGVYFGKVTAITAYGESAGSNEQTVTTTGTNISTITFNWTPVLGAISYRVYLTAAGGGAGNENVFAAVAGPGASTVTLTANPATSGSPPAASSIQYGGA